MWLISLVIALVLFSGCATQKYSNAEWKAGRIYLAHMGDTMPYFCRYRVAELARELDKDGEDFIECIGLYKGKPHTWIEQNGKIIDPSVGQVNPEYYIKVRSILHGNTLFKRD